MASQLEDFITKWTALSKLIESGHSIRKLAMMRKWSSPSVHSVAAWNNGVILAPLTRTSLMSYLAKANVVSVWLLFNARWSGLKHWASSLVLNDGIKTMISRAKPVLPYDVAACRGVLTNQSFSNSSRVWRYPLASEYHDNGSTWAQIKSSPNSLICESIYFRSFGIQPNVNPVYMG